MRRTVPTLMALITLGLPAAAVAADLTPLAGPPLRADGATEALVWLACDGCTPDGRVRVKTKGADVRSATVEDGHVRLALVPTPGGERLDLSIRVTQESGRIDADVSVPLAPPAEGRIRVLPDRSIVQPGEGPVTVTLTAPGGLEGARLVTSAGTLGAVAPGPDGALTVQWTPPSRARAAQLVAIAAVDPAAPAHRVGFTTVSLRTPASLTFEVPPDSDAVLVVGQERFGPYRASPAGTVAFEVALPPEAGAGTLEVTTAQGARDDRDVELPLGGGGAPLLVLPLPEAVPADPRAPVDVVVLALERDGTPSNEPPALTASRGTLGPLEPAIRPGLYRARWTAPAQTGTVEVTAKRGDVEHRGQARLVDGLPAVTLSAEPEALAHNATAWTLGAAVVAPKGGTAVVSLPRLEVSAGKAARRAQGQGGAYTLPLRVPAAAPFVTARAVPAAPSSAEPVAHLVGWSDPPARPGDPAPVTVVALDAGGLPVADLAVTLGVPDGSGTLPPSARTDASGTVLLTYDLGKDDAPSRLTATAGGREAAWSVLPGNRCAPDGGSDIDRARLERLRTAFPVLHLVRGEAPVAVVAAAPVVSTPAAAPVANGPGDPAASPASPAEAAPAATPSGRSTPASGPAWARISLTASGVGLVHGQEAEDGVGPAQLDTEVGNLFGGQAPEGFSPMLQGVAFPGGGNVGFDASVGLLRIPSPDTSGQFSELMGGAGLRLRRPVGERLHIYGVAQAERRPGFLFLTDSAGTLGEVAYPYWGLRLGAGLTALGDRWAAEVEVSETLAFAPVDARVTAAGDWFFHDTFGARLQLGLDVRSMRFEVGDSDVQVNDQTQYVGVGITARLP